VLSRLCALSRWSNRRHVLTFYKSSGARRHQLRQSWMPSQLTLSAYVRLSMQRFIFGMETL